MRHPANPPSTPVPSRPLREFATLAPRPLPVFVLADISGSMAVDGKIQALNQALRDMIEAFQGEEDLRAEILLSVLTFGDGRARIAQPLLPARQVSWSDLSASGNTPLGACLSLAQGLLEDRAVIPERSYRPTVVLVSDGQPNDAWQQPLQDLLASERSSRAFRFALAIGDDADLTVLRAFLGTPDAHVHRASEARQIRSFFRYVTMSITQRSRSTSPNQPAFAPPEDWDL